MIAAKQTSEEAFSGNLDASSPIITAADKPQTIIPVTIYDSLGNETKVSIEFRKTAIASGSNTTWTWSIASGAGVSASSATGTIMFDTKGQIVSGPSNTPALNISAGSGTGANSYKVTLDFTKLNMYSSDFTAKSTGGDGYPSGSLVTFNIGSDGLITGVYDNGKQQPLGLLGLASFENPGGLQRSGDNMYLPTTNSGEFKTAYKAGTGGVGVLDPGTLEMSNVDLAKEFTDMIVTERAFQANSRVITTADDMLQDINSMKR
jgi:flagellar hook protein FlgE